MNAIFLLLLVALPFRLVWQLHRMCHCAWDAQTHHFLLQFEYACIHLIPRTMVADLPFKLTCGCVHSTGCFCCYALAQCQSSFDGHSPENWVWMSPTNVNSHTHSLNLNGKWAKMFECVVTKPSWNCLPSGLWKSVGNSLGGECTSCDWGASGMGSRWWLRELTFSGDANIYVYICIKGCE